MAGEYVLNEGIQLWELWELTANGDFFFFSKLFDDGRRVLKKGERRRTNRWATNNCWASEKYNTVLNWWQGGVAGYIRAARLLETPRPAADLGRRSRGLLPCRHHLFKITLLTCVELRRWLECVSHNEANQLENSAQLPTRAHVILKGCHKVT